MPLTVRPTEPIGHAFAPSTRVAAPAGFATDGCDAITLWS